MSLIILIYSYSIYGILCFFQEKNGFKLVICGSNVKNNSNKHTV